MTEGEKMEQREEKFDTLVRFIEEDALNGKNYEYLGDYYMEENTEKAYLCYENALFWGNVDEEEIRNKIKELDKKNVNHHKVSIVILSYNAKEIMKGCIESIRKNNPKTAYELIVVDNASTDGVVDWLKEQKDIVLACNQENVGFPKGCNQGIELAEKENDIMLLNNDTIVTENALFWLRMTICEHPIGAAGSISNMTEKVSATVKGKETRSMEEQLEYARYNNVLLKHSFECRVSLLGYALLFKRTALEKTGYLDEIFSPGCFEDLDISIRLIQEGYQLALCYNSFIFHYGSTSFKKNIDWYENLITKNFYVYKEKYGFDVDYYMNQRDDLIEHLPNDTNCAFQLLDVGCGCGSTMLRIEGLYPNAEVVGVEKCVEAVKIGKKLAEIYEMDIEKQELPFEKSRFDYIFMGNVLEQTSNPREVLRKVKKYLKPQGKIIASIYNCGNVKNIYGLMQGKVYETERYGLWDIKNIQCFTGEKILQLFENVGLQVKDITYLENELSEGEELFLRQTEDMPNRVPQELLRAYNYILIAEN